MIKKIVKYYDNDTGAGTGGAVFNINVDPVALRASAEKYNQAVTAYKTARGNIETALKAVLEAWDDASKESYSEKVGLALGELDAIQKTLESNSSKLSNIATFAEETENNVKKGVDSIQIVDRQSQQ